MVLNIAQLLSLNVTQKKISYKRIVMCTKCQTYASQETASKYHYTSTGLVVMLLIGSKSVFLNL